eukprot:499500_1
MFRIFILTVLWITSNASDFTTCPDASTFDCGTTYTDIYGDDEICCSTQSSVGSAVYSYKNKCYYECNSASSGGAYYSSYNCGPCCSTAANDAGTVTACVANDAGTVPNCYVGSDDTLTDGYCSSRQSGSTTTCPHSDCEVTLTAPCAYKGVDGLTCLPDTSSNSADCYRCQQPPATTQASADATTTQASADITTTAKTYTNVCADPICTVGEDCDDAYDDGTAFTGTCSLHLNSYDRDPCPFCKPSSTGNCGTAAENPCLSIALNEPCSYNGVDGTCQSTTWGSSDCLRCVADTVTTTKNPCRSVENALPCLTKEEGDTCGSNDAGGLYYSKGECVEDSDSGCLVCEAQATTATPTDEATTGSDHDCLSLNNPCGSADSSVACTNPATGVSGTCQSFSGSNCRRCVPDTTVTTKEPDATTTQGSDADTTDGGSDTDTTDGGSDADTTDGGSDTATTDGGSNADTTDGGSDADTTLATTDAPDCTTDRYPYRWASDCSDDDKDGCKLIVSFEVEVCSIFGLTPLRLRYIYKDAIRKIIAELEDDTVECDLADIRYVWTPPVCIAKNADGTDVDESTREHRGSYVATTSSECPDLDDWCGADGSRPQFEIPLDLELYCGSCEELDVLRITLGKLLLGGTLKSDYAEKCQALSKTEDSVCEHGFRKVDVVADITVTLEDANGDVIEEDVITLGGSGASRYGCYMSVMMVLVMFSFY